VGGIYLATGAVQVISHIIGQEWNWDFHPILLMLYVLLLYMLLGFLIALPELPILWHYHRGPILWLLVNMIGWFILGLVVGFSIDRPSDIFAVGAIPAIFTGFGLIWLMRTPRTEPDRSP
jgi:hypothetical protein